MKHLNEGMLIQMSVNLFGLAKTYEILEHEGIQGIISALGTTEKREV